MHSSESVPSIGVALIGCGGIALANHLPGLALCAAARLVALCDADEEALRRAGQQTGIGVLSPDYREIVAHPEVRAVIVATPNVSHASIAHAVLAAGKHLLCEKPIALNFAEAMELWRQARAASVRHMTAFTYRFVPAMRYLAHLVGQGAVGEPYHVRTCRLQDWGTRSLGWRQVRALAGSGELGDMLSHRIDFAHLLVGPIRRVVANLRQFHPQREGKASDLEDWAGVLAEFANGATGVFESSKVATGRGEGGRSRDYCEINGSEGTLVYHLARPFEVQVGRRGGRQLEEVRVPDEFLRWPGSPRDPAQGDPLATFRYDQDVEFISAIREQRPCRPSLREGVRVQAVMHAAIRSAEEGRWVEVPSIED